MKSKLTLLLFFVSFFVWAQLANFTVSVGATPETCPNNGTLTWTTSGTTSGSIMMYSVYKSPNFTTPIVSTSSTGISGLAAGTYRVIATQSLGTQSNQATSSDVSISNNLVPLTYTVGNIVNESCGNDGRFAINVSSGRPPYTYQLLDSSLNVITTQSSNVFTGLTAGTYRVRVVDQCGAGVAVIQTINYTPSNINSFNLTGNYTADCSGVNLSIYATSWTLKFPLVMSIKYTNPNTGLQETVTSPSVNGLPTLTIPNFTTIDTIDLDVTITDACGYSKTIPITYQYKPFVYPTSVSSNCGGAYHIFQTSTGVNQTGVTAFKVDFTSFPSGFNPSVVNPNHGTYQTFHSYGTLTAPMPSGTYNYIITDKCGRTQNGSFVVGAVSPPSINTFSRNECKTDLKTMHGMLQPLGYGFNTIKITSAPAEFISTYGALPYSVPSENISTDLRSFSISHMPYGSYTIEYTTNCDATVWTQNFNLIANAATTLPTTTVEQSCSGQFKVNITHNDYYLVQKWYPAIGKWGKAPNYYTDGTGTNYNNTGWMYDWSTFGTYHNAPDGPGLYRIVTNAHSIVYGGYYNYQNGVYTFNFCDAVVLKEFELGTGLTFISANAFQCANGTYDVTLTATGNAPLTYAIVSDNTSSATTIINNGTSPVFTGLPAGTYYFRVYDNCGNFITKKLDIATLGQPSIRKVVDCAAGTIKLVVDGLDYLNFKWYKSTDPTTALSTTNVLDLGVFDASKAGVYKVQLTNAGNTTSCINSVLELNITVDTFTNPSAGTGQTITLYSTPTSLNLFDYLTGNYEGGGTWTETSTLPSNLLTGNTFYANFAPSGTYDFKYTVNALCGSNTSTSTVRIVLVKVCYKLPATTGGATLPVNFGITALGRAGVVDNTLQDPNKNNWPNIRAGAWAALEANTKGFVVNRVAFDTNNLPIGISPANFVAGMAVYDTTNDCLKIYNGTIWSCFTTQTCPE